MPRGWVLAGGAQVQGQVGCRGKLGEHHCLLAFHTNVLRLYLPLRCRNALLTIDNVLVTRFKAVFCVYIVGNLQRVAPRPITPPSYLLPPSPPPQPHPFPSAWPLFSSQLFGTNTAGVEPSRASYLQSTRIPPLQRSQLASTKWPGAYTAVEKPPHGVSTASTKEPLIRRRNRKQVGKYRGNAVTAKSQVRVKQAAHGVVFVFVLCCV